MSVWDAWKDAEKSTPNATGWYPALCVLPDNEGIMPHGAFWNGSEWRNERGDDAVHFFMTQSFKSREAALRTAYANDVEDVK